MPATIEAARKSVVAEPELEGCDLRDSCVPRLIAETV
jgi:hypothetical protein